VNGKPQQRLRLEKVANASDLQHEGGTLFVPDASRTPVPPGERTIEQGFVEESNVNAMTVMTDMITVLRRFGEAQKLISTLDATRGIAVTELAKPV
jgi:flagellar basal body rod protein FlgG